MAHVDLGEFESHVSLAEFGSQSVINTRYIRGDLHQHLIDCLKPDLDTTEVKKQNLNEILSNNTEKRLDMLAAKFSYLEAIIFSVKPHIGSTRDSVMAILDVSFLLEDYYVRGTKMTNRGRESFLTKCDGDILMAI